MTNNKHFCGIVNFIFMVPTYPRAISKLLISFLIFQISTFLSADVSSLDILLLLFCCAYSVIYFTNILQLLLLFLLLSLVYFWRSTCRFVRESCARNLSGFADLKWFNEKKMPRSPVFLFGCSSVRAPFRSLVVQNVRGLHEEIELSREKKRNTKKIKKKRRKNLLVISM